MKYEDFIAKLKEEVGTGLSLESKKTLYGLDLKDIPRQYRVELASLASRGKYHFLGLRILSPVVVGEKSQLRDDATDQEEFEYCHLLRKIGSTEEAKNRLKNIDFDRFPRAHLEMAFCYFSQWNYGEAIPWLQRFSECEKVSEMERQRAGLHLLKAYISHQDFDSAAQLAPDILQWIVDSGHENLKCDFYSLMAEMDLFNDNFDEAKANLETAQRYLKSPFDRVSLEIDKWMSVIQAKESGSIEPIEDFKSKANVLQKYESLRDCDLFQIKLNFDPQLFRRLVYGTPFTNYHKRVTQFLKIETPLPGLSPLGPGADVPLHLYFGEKDEKAIFNPGKDVHKLIYCLASDLYRPWSLGALNQMLFPDELFNVYTVPNKIHQLVHRARKELVSDGLKMEILERHNVYTIDCDQQDLIVDLKKQIPDPNEILLEKVHSEFGDKNFTSCELTDQFHQSKSATQRFLSWGVSQGRVMKLKEGRQVYYQFNSSSKKAA